MKRNTTSTVDAIGNMTIDGNITPATWYLTIKERNKRGSYPHLLAINILSDIVYWHRPTIIRHEKKSNVIEIRKKFDADKLQKDYNDYAEMFGVSYKLSREACKFLESLGILILEFRDVKSKNGVLQNVCFMDLNVQKLKEFTEPTKELIETMGSKIVEPITQLGNKVLTKPITELGNDRLPNSATSTTPIGKEGIAELGGTYTDTTTNNTSNTTTESEKEILQISTLAPDPDNEIDILTNNNPNVDALETKESEETPPVPPAPSFSDGRIVSKKRGQANVAIPSSYAAPVEKIGKLTEDEVIETLTTKYLEEANKNTFKAKLIKHGYMTEQAPLTFKQSQLIYGVYAEWVVNKEFTRNEPNIFEMKFLSALDWIKEKNLIKENILTPLKNNISQPKQKPRY